MKAPTPPRPHDRPYDAKASAPLLPCLVVFLAFAFVVAVALLFPSGADDILHWWRSR